MSEQEQSTDNTTQETRKRHERNCAIKQCTCASAYQDEVYGRHMRVHARTNQNGPIEYRGWRCSVCAREIK